MRDECEDGNMNIFRLFKVTRCNIYLWNVWRFAVANYFWQLSSLTPCQNITTMIMAE